MTGPEYGNLLSDNPDLYEARSPAPDHTAARFVDDILRAYLPVQTASRECQPHSVLVRGGGAGRDLVHLGGRGYRCVGLDQSEAMVRRYARSRYQGATLKVGDLREFELGDKVDAVICLDSSLLYRHTDRGLESCLSSCRRHLRDGAPLVAEMRNGALFLGHTELLNGPATHPPPGKKSPGTSRPQGRSTTPASCCVAIDAGVLPTDRVTSSRPPPGGCCSPPSSKATCTAQALRAIVDTPGLRTEGGWQIPPYPRELPRLFAATPLPGHRLRIVAEAV